MDFVPWNRKIRNFMDFIREKWKTGTWPIIREPFGRSLWELIILHI